MNGKPRQRAQLGIVPNTSMKFHRIPFSSIGELGRTRLNPYIVYSKKTIKSHNSVKNCLNGKPIERTQLGLVPNTSVKFH